MKLYLKLNFERKNVNWYVSYCKIIKMAVLLINTSDENNDTCYHNLVRI